MPSRKRRQAVLLDNFTLQGAYCYLQLGKREWLYEECVSHLIESIVIYDRIVVPYDVLSRNPACKHVTKQFPRIIVGRSMPNAPDIHHHVIDPAIVEKFKPLLRTNNPLSEFETPTSYFIEKEGHPYPNSIGSIGRYLPRLTFSERHTYYTWYCVRLSAALGLNYAPNPTRANLLEDPRFFKLRVFPNFGRDIVNYFEKVRKRHATSVREVFRSLPTAFNLPMIYSYVKSKAEKSDEIIATAKRLRNSRKAVAFRNFCAELEEASQKGDMAAIDEKKIQIEELGNRWSKSLAPAKGRRKWTISYIIGTDFETPWFNLRAVDRKPHFVFLHSLLSAPGV